MMRTSASIAHSSLLCQPKPQEPSAHQNPVRGVALDLKQAQLAIRHVPDHPGMAAKIFQLLADRNVSVDMIIQSQRCRVLDRVIRDVRLS